MSAPLSASNPRVITLRRLLGRRRARLEAGAFVIEGPLALTEAIVAAAPLREVYVDDAAARSAPPDSALGVGLAAAREAGVPVTELGAGVLQRVSDTVTSQDVLAVVERRPVPIEALVAADGPVVVLAGVGDPGNAGTVVRTAEAAGAAGVLFCFDAVDPFGPKTVRAAAGSLFRILVAENPTASSATALEALRAGGRELIGTEARGGVDLDRRDLTAPFALVLGSEARGLPAELETMLDSTVTIPMAGSVESLNVAVAAAVVLFESARQHRRRR